MILNKTDNIPSAAPRPAPLTRRGFSLIELLIVIGVIGILISIIVVVSKGLIGNSKGTQTKILLASLQGILDEGEGNKIFSRVPPEWLWLKPGTTNTWVIANQNPISGQTNLDFWKLPYYDTSATTVQPMPLPSPGSVQAGQFGQYGSPAVINTQLALQMLSYLPANNKAMSGLPAGRMRAFTWDNPSDTSVFYPAGLRVTVILSGGARLPLLANTFPTSSARITPAPTAATPSYPAVATGEYIAPLVMDAWDQPMIFVPASGLKLANGTIIKSPTGKPFFASAGPDGSFDTPDDNLYSYEP